MVFGVLGSILGSNEEIPNLARFGPNRADLGDSPPPTQDLDPPVQIFISPTLDTPTNNLNGIMREI